MNRVAIEFEYWEKEANSKDIGRAICDPGLEDDCYKAVQIGLNKGKILEIGCGIGRMIDEIYKHEEYQDSKFYGIDISDSMLTYSSIKHNPHWVEQKICDGRTIPYRANFFDSVYSIAVFQHIDDAGLRSYMKEAWRVLKFGGRFRFQFVDGDEKIAFSWQRSVSEVTEMIEDAGFISTLDNQLGLVYPNWRWITVAKTKRV